MMCVTGASGTVGSEVIRQLAAAQVAFRAGYFSQEKAQAVGVQHIVKQSVLGADAEAFVLARIHQRGTGLGPLSQTAL